MTPKVQTYPKSWLLTPPPNTKSCWHRLHIFFMWILHDASELFACHMNCIFCLFQIIVIRNTNDMHAWTIIKTNLTFTFSTSWLNLANVFNRSKRKDKTAKMKPEQWEYLQCSPLTDVVWKYNFMFNNDVKATKNWS